ncbi:MAG: prolipoprotein diacylglyceryl transferase [Bacteroidia bacterium]
MYPTIYHAIKDLFGFEIPFLQIANTFGFFVAISFLAANYAMVLELRRKEKDGILLPTTKMEKFGNPMPVSDYIVNSMIGFVFGYKILPLLFDNSLISNGAQEYIFSLNGNWITGIALAGLLLFLKYREDKKQRLPEPEERLVVVHPWQHMGYLTLVAAVSGILGAKLFHQLEYWKDFVADPMGNIFSASGLTFFGGLICGGIGVVWAANKKGIKPLHMLDVGGPAMILSYGLGRFGCHFSGDGDWGIVNTASKPEWMSFLPDWAWAYNYPNNVGRECDPTGGSMPCDFDTTPFLQLPVWPTPLYEALAGLALFGVLWLIRKRIKPAGALFGIYLMMAGIERFFIEQIRVNSTYDWGFLKPTQAEIISVVLFLAGVALLIYAFQKHKNTEIPVKEE